MTGGGRDLQAGRVPSMWESTMPLLFAAVAVAVRELKRNLAKF